MEMNDRERIRAFIGDLLREQDDRGEFADGESLIRSGRLDSLAVTKIVMFLETGFEVDFARVEFDPERFDSVDEIAAVIAESRALG